jgi:serine/threonine protein kinase
LKPENCLLTSEGKVKICDMGLAKTKNGFGGRSSSAMTSGVGTMSYMPPEAFDEDFINSETYDPRLVGFLSPA